MAATSSFVAVAERARPNDGNLRQITGAWPPLLPTCSSILLKNLTSSALFPCLSSWGISPEISPGTRTLLSSANPAPPCFLWCLCSGWPLCLNVFSFWSVHIPAHIPLHHHFSRPNRKTFSDQPQLLLCQAQHEHPKCIYYLISSLWKLWGGCCYNPHFSET